MNTATITLLPRPTRLTTSVVEDVGTPGVWRVEAIDYGSGGIAQLTVFVGRDAERRARAYASWQYHPVLAAPAE